MFSLRSSSYDLRSWQIHSFDLVGLKQLLMVLTPFLTFQLTSGKHYLTLFALVLFEDFKTEIHRVLLLCRFFWLYILVNISFFNVFY